MRRRNGASVGSVFWPYEAYRNKIRQQAAGYGRNPDDIKVLFLAHPIIDVSMEAARDRVRMEAAEAEKHLDLHLSGMSRLTGIDFAKKRASFAATVENDPRSI